MSQKRKKSLNKPSQSQREETDPTEALEESIKKCVRLFIVASERNLPVQKSDIKKRIPTLKTSETFQLVLKQTEKELKNTFGYKLVEFTDEGAFFYVLVKSIGNDLEGDLDTKKDPKKILTLLVLSHVFMSGESTPEASMISFLNSLKINLNKNHSLFGNVKEFVFGTLEKQKYLSVTVDDLTKKKSFKWGPRAEATVSKEAVLKFVCKNYGSAGSVQPQQFKEQFEQAQQQNLQNQN